MLRAPASATASASASASTARHRADTSRARLLAPRARADASRDVRAARRHLSVPTRRRRHQRRSTLARAPRSVADPRARDDAVDVVRLETLDAREGETRAVDDADEVILSSTGGGDDDDDALDRIVLNFSPEYDFSEKMVDIGAYFARSPAELAVRAAEVVATAAAVYATWTYEERANVPKEKRTRGRKLRDGVAKLGPVFIKMAQTLSTRPDIIGEEAAENLEVLQDQVGPFSSDEAREIIRRELGWRGAVTEGEASAPGPVHSLYKELSDEPIAAASIGQVYEGRLHDGTKVAVKVQRPGMVRRIALDLHIIRLGFNWVEESGLNGSEDLDKIVDQVGAGVFQELDYTIEARNADAFRKSLKFLDFVYVPRHHAAMTTKKVLTQDWIVGRPMKALSLEEQKLMVQMGVECSSAQLFRTGLVHADPHEGNMLFTDDGRLALLDFGLICRVDDEQQEAMANCILNILNSQWGELIDNLRVMDMLPETPQMWIDEDGNQADYTQGGPGSWKPITDAEFRRAFEVCMDGEEGNPKVRANFTELVIDLTKISTAYRFNLPPYMVFVIRSLTTLDFAAARTKCNMYEVAAPTAIFRALSPRTARGKKALATMLLDDDGRVNWAKLEQLSAQAGSAAEQGDRDDVSSSVADEHARDAVARLANELVDSSAGRTLRRLAVNANPESVLPPPSVRAALVDAARASAEQSAATFSFRGLVRGIADAVRALITGGGPPGEHVACEVFQEGPARSACNAQMDKRRRRVAIMVLKSKLSSPSGAASALRLCGIVVWALVSGVVAGIATKLRRAWARSTSGSPNRVPPLAPA